MSNYLQLLDAQKRLVLEQCRNKIGLPEQAVEKDMWVTVILQLLFDSELAKEMIFKGGTSLSKGGGLIERFSEDIDLAVNPHLFGVENLPTKRQLKKLRKASSLFVKEQLSVILQNQIERYQLSEWLTIEVEKDGEGDSTYPEPRHLYVYYKSLLPLTLGYIKPMVVLEIGARSLMEPVVNLSLKSIIEEQMPTINTEICSAIIPTAAPQKTFVEKAFLLHELFSIERDKLSASRRSRHLYDLAMMMDKDFAVNAIADDKLWASVRLHREKFTSVQGIDYSHDIRGSIILLPPGNFIDDWKNDYRMMSESMIYGDKPSWEELLNKINELQLRIRNH